MTRPVIPAIAYRIFGGIGWKQQARQWGVEKQLKSRPYVSER
jgi:hypothetical protein